MEIIKLKNIRKITHISKRYDITTQKNHNLFANNIVVHNCTSIYNDYYHARSLDSKNHPSRNCVKRMAGEIMYLIPDDVRICGENLYAKHSIYYENLESYFYAFSVWKENYCYSWDDTVKFCNDLNLLTVPVLYRGIYDETKIKELYTGSYNGDPMEGYVIRITDGFTHDFDNPKNTFFQHFAKCVRINHVNTDQHWMTNTVIPNKLK